jgi:hypothetical protein
MQLTYHAESWEKKKVKFGGKHDICGLRGKGERGYLLYSPGFCNATNRKT